MRSPFFAGLMSALMLNATSQAAVLTPEKLLTAPRPGDGIANPAGTRALIGCRTFSFKQDAFNEILYVLELPSTSEAIQKTALDATNLEAISHKVSSGFWLSNDIAAYVDSADNKVYAKDVSMDSLDEGQESWTAIGTLDTPIDDVKVAFSESGTAKSLVFSASVYSDGDLSSVKRHDESDAAKEWERVKVYDSTFVRHWDKWIDGKRTQLFAADIQHGDKVSDWSLGNVRNLLNGTTLAIPPPPNGGAADWSVSADHVIFTSKDPDLTPSWHTKQNIYIVPLKGSSKPVELTKGKHGATSSPVFSNDGKKVAWLQMDRDSFEADRRKIHVASISEGSESQIYAEDWHLSPSSIAFAIDDKSLVGIVEKEEQEVLFEVDLEKKSSAPKLLSHYGGIGSLQVMKHGILISASSLRGPTDLYLVSPHASENAQFKTKARRLTNFAESEGSSLAGIELGPHPEQFQYPGHKGRTAYGWIHYPPSYDASKTYALVVGIHGGPEGCWSNSWSTRWNPAVFTAQDFIMITLDPAGSTSFGQDYQEEILHNWGGAPYHDIIAGTRHILQRFPNIDPERVVAAGASYGGYMMNWIAGHNEDKLFKGLVCHDGVFSTNAVWYSTDELYFPEFEFNGPPWQARELYDKWNPEKFTDKWETPQLTIAGGKDFRLPVTEGLAAFNTLQRRGVPSRFVYFDQENHWVLEPKNSLKWHQEVLGWLLKYSAPQEKKVDNVSFVCQS